LAGKPIQIHGNGSQTRSHCYIADLVEAIWRVSQYANLKGQVLNIGNPDERTILELAHLVVEVTGGHVAIEHLPPRDEDPQRRCPDIRKLHELTSWEPCTTLREGVQKTIAYYREQIGIGYAPAD
jgi:nucleoside-diphosphate-sugar epimerase